MPLSAQQPVFLADRWSSKSASDVQKNVCRSRYKHQMQMPGAVGHAQKTGEISAEPDMNISCRKLQIREGADTVKESSGILPESDL